jgi:Tfp pilus assembly protein PilO
MNKNVTPIILIVLAIGIYFTVTTGKLDELKSIRAVNADYEQAINNSEKLIKVRDKVLKTYNDISEEDRQRLDKMVPDNVDNVRLIIDVNGVAARHGIAVKNIKTSTPSSNTGSVQSQPPATINKPKSVAGGVLDTVTLSFSVSTNYQTFIDFMKDLEASLRIMDISKITLTANDTGIYEYGVEIKTYWLKY